MNRAISLCSIVIASLSLIAISANAATLSPAGSAAVLLTPNNIVANQYHAVAGGSSAFAVATDGVIDHGASGQNNGFDTWPAGTDGPQGPSPGTDNAFVGLTYAQQTKFNEVAAYMGHQFGDGGNWASLPNLYILTNPYSSLPDNGQLPPDLDPTDWTLVPTADYVVHSGTPSAADAVGAGPAAPYDYVLTTALTGYGWALGGVASPSNGSNFVSITELQAFAYVPEPGSIAALAGLAAMGLIGACWRRRRT
jgi:hypothetical protein